MENFGEITLQEVLDYLTNLGLNVKIKTRKIDTGSGLWLTDYINVKNEDRYIEIEPDWKGRKLKKVKDENSRWEKTIVDKTFSTDAFSVNTVKKLYDSDYPWESHSSGFKNFKTLENIFLKDFLNLKIKQKQMNLFDF